MAHWLRLWFLPKGAPMAQWRAARRAAVEQRLVVDRPGSWAGRRSQDARTGEPLVVGAMEIAQPTPEAMEIAKRATA